MKTEELIELLTGLQMQIQAEDSMAFAARKVLLAELPKLLQCESAFLCSDDVEAIHHMRVSCRRIRSAMRLMRPFYDEKKVKLLHTGIQELGKNLAL